MSFVKMKTGLLFLICVLIAAFALVSIPSQSFSEEAAFSEETKRGAYNDGWTLFNDKNLSSVALNAAVPTMPDIAASNSVVADACLALLTADKAASQKQAAISSVPPVAGQAAALSLLLGVRYALGPVEKPGAAKTGQTPTVHVDGQRAAAIAQYRRCRNDQNLAQNSVAL